MYHAGAGVDADLLQEMSRRSGCLFEIKNLLRVDLWPAMTSGEIDMATSSISTHERARIARFVTFLGFKNMMVMPTKEVGTTFSLAALVAKPKWRLGLVKGFRYGNYYDYNLKMLLGDNRIVEFETHEQLFAALRMGSVEAILAPSVHFFFYLTADEQQHFTMINASPAPPTPSGFAFARTQFTAPQVDNWLRLIESMRLDKTLHRLVERRISKAAMATLIEY
ncbi:substrate-binding periplasmic protein [Dongia sp.]|uniref:substrate-binding periplasmic protein n=1 Tax=Dongia sp. TaxID=1977262 RepID=UPI0035B233B7